MVQSSNISFPLFTYVRDSSIFVMHSDNMDAEKSKCSLAGILIKSILNRYGPDMIPVGPT